MNTKVDFKKQDKELYLPPGRPVLVDVPELTFIAVAGAGNPNDNPLYQEALDLLYGLSFTIKMSKMGEYQPPGYFDYAMPPLEGLWWGEDGYYDGLNITDKSKFHWQTMIRQPQFVTAEVVAWAKEQLAKKKPQLPLDKARLYTFKEGLCVQMLHRGPYDEEPQTVRQLTQFAAENGYQIEINDQRRHHEIYLNDPRRTKPENLKTVVRHPVGKG